MKKVFLFAVALGIAISLTGCQSGKNLSDTDDAQSALIDSQSQTEVNAPPVPPVPSKPAN